MDKTESTALLHSAKAGSNAALGRLLDRHAGRLLTLIRVRMGPALRERLESRDILNATLLKAFERLEQFERSDTASLVAWLSRIAENELRDQAEYHHRQRRDLDLAVSLSGVADGLAARVRSQVSQMILDEALSGVERALDSLSADHREIILLRKLEELSFAEIGRRMSRSPDACRMLLARALTALTLKLGETT